MTESFDCTRCDRTDATRLLAAPLPTDLGARIQTEICHECWEEWKKHQMLLINHYGLKLQEAKSRDYLYAQMRAFLFADGDLAEIDPNKQGSVDW